ncbi:hypothetical protein [Sagittula sp. S175]|uniref:hypothetical protein n=1 Tax=Sagittula sp. S175 TaxID=3415129 RepID=UPI003C7C24A0
MSDVEDRIRALISADPLPADAEAQLQTLLAELPELDRDVQAGDWEEALFTARQAAEFDADAPRIELDL